MEDWQQRVIDERKEISERLTKLAAFLSRGAPGASEKGRDLLRRQRNAMLDYGDVLDERILDFSNFNEDLQRSRADRDRQAGPDPHDAERQRSREEGLTAQWMCPR